MNLRTSKIAVVAASAALIAAGAALTAATMSSPAEAAPAARSAAAAPYRIDGVHSSVVYKIKHNNVSNFYGIFSGIKGEFSLEDGGSINVTVDAGSILSGNSKRDEHLRSPDFFSAKEYPEITFKSTSMKKVGDGRFEATGTLTLRGQSKPLTVTIEHTGDGEGRRGPVSGLETRFTIKRSEFGMVYGLGQGLSDEVEVIVSLQGGAQG